MDLESYDADPALLDDLSVEGPESLVEAGEEIRAALASITLKYRTCFVLYHIQQYSKQEIADFMNIAESSVSTYISLAIEEFRQKRANQHVDSTTQIRIRGGKNCYVLAADLRYDKIEG
jgi:DNA-directed RNA polymerase specialized sigma24 family protein